MSRRERKTFRNIEILLECTRIAIFITSQTRKLKNHYICHVKSNSSNHMSDFSFMKLSFDLKIMRSNGKKLHNFIFRCLVQISSTFNRYERVNHSRIPEDLPQSSLKCGNNSGSIWSGLGGKSREGKCKSSNFKNNVWSTLSASWWKKCGKWISIFSSTRTTDFPQKRSIPPAFPSPSCETCVMLWNTAWYPRFWQKQSATMKWAKVFVCNLPRHNLGAT